MTSFIDTKSQAQLRPVRFFQIGELHQASQRQPWAGDFADQQLQVFHLLDDKPGQVRPREKILVRDYP